MSLCSASNNWTAKADYVIIGDAIGSADTRQIAIALVLIVVVAIY